MLVSSVNIAHESFLFFYKIIHNLSFQIKHDFVAFARMFLIFMIAGGVTIQAILYPNWPLTWEMIRRVITRPIYSMFLTPITDLDGKMLWTSSKCVTYILKYNEKKKL